jgi:hypothetical protein
MLKYTCMLLLCFMLFSAQAQDTTALPIDLQRLEACINKTAIQVSNTLISEGWKLNAELTGSVDGDSYRTFSFGNMETDQKKAIAWLRIHSAGTPVNRVYYQAPDEETFAKLVEEIKGRKTTASLPQTIEGQTLMVYTGDNFAYQTIVAGTTYTVVVISKHFLASHSAPQ